MYRSVRIVALLSTVFIVGSCATHAPEAADGPSRVLSEFVSALNHADIDGLTRLFAPDATAFLPMESSPTLLAGQQAIRDALAPFLQQLRAQGNGPEYMHLVARDVHVQSSGRFAVVTFNAGSGPVTSRRSLILENTARGWLIVHFHGSNVRQAGAGAGPD